jgi:Tfp pilus assembly protein PilX
MINQTGATFMHTRASQRGMALIMVMLLTVAVAAVAAGAIFLTSSATLISKGQEREEEMRNAADAGIELGRSLLNGGSVVMPDTGYVAYQVNQPVVDANGNQISGVTRSIYYGPTSSTTGQYGVFGSIVSVITDRSGAVVVRRGELNQESFAKFGYFTDNEGLGICFGGGDNIFGPLHTNDNMCIYSSGATFWKSVEIAGTLTGASYGTFKQGYTQNASVIPMPTLADLNKLNTYATVGGMSFTEPTPSSTPGKHRIRLQFVAIDLDGDGKVTGPDEGFYRIYSDTGTPSTDYVNASRTATPTASRNCGHFHGTVFYTANEHLKGWGAGATFPAGHTGTLTKGTASATEALTSSATGALRCWLGGDEHLFVTSAAGGPTPRNTFVPADSFGQWLQFTATPDPRVVAGLANTASKTVDTSAANRAILAQYLWPASRIYNPNSKGVIFFTGNVAVDGVLNGKITVAATKQIMIADDITYAIAPGSAPCLAANILGILSGDSILMQDNTINASWDYTGGTTATGSGVQRNYDDTNDEFLQGVVMTLESFSTEHYTTGATSGQPCQTTSWGRGCLYLTGGIIQGTRGAVALTSGTGYVKRYSYDLCAFQTPPPYFPTTGRYVRNRYYEIDPVGFTVSGFFAALTP